MLLSRSKPELVVPRPTPLLARSPVLGGRGRPAPHHPRGRVGVKAGAHLPPHVTVGPLPATFQINLDDLEAEVQKPEEFIKVDYRHGQLVVEDAALSTLPVWLSQVRTARDRHEQNLEALRDTRGHVYLRTVRDVSEGEQLLVWYGDELAREMGIPVLSPHNIRGDQQYICTYCLKSYKYPNQLKAHIRFRCRNACATPGQQAVEAYYKHTLAHAHRIEAARDLSCKQSAFSPTHKSPASDIKEEGEKRSQDSQTHAHLMNSLMAFPHMRGQMDPSLALSYYQCHPLYSQLYPNMAYYYHQMAPLLPGMHAPLSPVSPLTPVSPVSDHSKSGKDLSPVQVSPMGFPLPSETAGEPLDLLPRSLYTSKSRKGHLCIYCGKLYSRKYGLKIHLRTHTGYKPLKCKVCQRPFGDPSNLNKHIRLHAEGDTPYRCVHCGKVLVRRRDLERHIKSRHPDVAEAEVLPASAAGSPDGDAGSEGPGPSCHLTGSDEEDGSIRCLNDSHSDDHDSEESMDDEEDIEVD